MSIRYSTPPSSTEIHPIAVSLVVGIDAAALHRPHDQRRHAGLARHRRQRSVGEVRHGDAVRAHSVVAGIGERPRRGHLWVPNIRSGALTRHDALASWGPMSRILYRLLVSLARLAMYSGRSKDLEIIVLRHQLTVLHRQNSRSALADEDRTLLGAIAATLSRRQRAGWLVTPETLLRWHRRGIACHWTLWVPKTRPFGAWRNARAPITNSGLTPPSSASQPTASIRHIHHCPRRLI